MFLKRLSVLLCLLCAADGYAFKVQYGNFFTIDRVRVEQGLPVLPLTRGKYETVRIVGKDTLEYIKNCRGAVEKEVCTQPAAERVTLRAGEIIPVPENPCQWRVEVVFDGQWLVQALAEKAGEQYKITYPRAFAFVRTDSVHKKTTAHTMFEKQVSDFIQHKLEGMFPYEMCAPANR